MTPEGKVVALIKKRVKEMGGECRKLSYEGRIGAPDLMILLPGEHHFVEVKREGEKPRFSQLREIERLKNSGCQVTWVAGEAQATRFMDSLEK